jgi:glycosyltransferase involved in cell wall biosynthesis
MKVLVVHNFYQHPGGEDGVFADEANLLERHGHSVYRYEAHNDEIRDMSGFQRLAAGAGTIWNRNSHRTITDIIRKERPDVMHVHNTLPLLSPAIYHAARDEGVAVVQTLHNYRMLCPGALFYRDGKICEDCLGKAPLPAIVHGCYRDSTVASGAVAAMLITHRLMGTWTRTINRYISMTQFGKSKFVAGGIPDEKIIVKPHFVNADLQPGDGNGGYVLFVGRLTDDKGIPVLLDAWMRQRTDLHLKIAGDGPVRDTVEEACRENPTIEWLGQRNSKEIYELMSKAAAVVVPSVWYETFGRVVAESFAVGTPVIVSRIGAIEELVDSGRTGMHFSPGHGQDLAERFNWLADHPDELKEMRRQARSEYERRFSSDENYRQLIAVYDEAIADVNVALA